MQLTNGECDEGNGGRASAVVGGAMLHDQGGAWSACNACGVVSTGS
jgi:hypothetical protein